MIKGYQNIRAEVKSGDLLAWTHRGWGSYHEVELQIVRMATRSEYCHVGAAFWVGPRLMVAEAVVKGVRIVPLSSLLPCYWTAMPAIKWTPGTDEWVFRTLGEDYSKWRAIRAGLGRPVRQSPPPWQCAEFYKAVAKAGGVEFKRPSTPAEVMHEAQRMLDSTTQWVEA